MKRILCLAALVGSGVGYAVAAKPVDWLAPLKPAHEAEVAGDFGRAHELYARVAQDNPLAQFALGRLLLNGQGRPRDAAAACAWFEKAARQRIPAAEHQWGECLAEGVGGDRNLAAALSWWERAAGHGHLISLCRAADHHIRGLGVPRDIARGIEMCTRVAQAGSAPAMLQLAAYYQDGRELPQNLAQARQWLQGAAELGHAEAQYRLGVMLAQGEGGEPDLDQARAWLESAARQGHVPAYLPTAVLYANAPVQPDTGILAPEHLARIYFWNSAAAARSTVPEERVEIERIAALVGQVMPPAWRPPLDQQLAEHLARFPAPAVTPNR